MENFDPNKTPKKQILSAQIDLSKFERATDEEKRQQDVMSESTSFFKDGMRKLFKNPLAVLSIVVLAAIILTIIIAPMIATDLMGLLSESKEYEPVMPFTPSMVLMASMTACLYSSVPAVRPASSAAFRP